MSKKPFGEVSTRTGWVGVPAKKSVESVKKGKRRLVLYPVFLKCGEYFEKKDPFWTKIFVSMAVNKFPKGFSIKGGSIVFNKNNKPIMENIDLSGSIKSIIKTTINFYKKHGNIYSDLDKKKISLICEKERMKRMPDLTWGSCGKKNRENLVNKFSEELTELLELTEAEKRRLLYVIRTGVLLKIFDKTNIILIDNKIDKIEGLLWNKKNRTFSIDRELLDDSTDEYINEDEEELKRYITKTNRLVRPDFINEFSLIMDSLHKKETISKTKKKKIVVEEENNDE